MARLNPAWMEHVPGGKKCVYVGVAVDQWPVHVTVGHKITLDKLDFPDGVLPPTRDMILRLPARIAISSRAMDIRSTT